MRNDQHFELLLVVLLPMYGCYDGNGFEEVECTQEQSWYFIRAHLSDD